MTLFARVVRTRQRRALVLGVALVVVLGSVVVVAATVHRGATGTIDLLATRGGVDRLRFESVDLRGAGVAAALTPSTTEIATAPTPSDLGIYSVPVGTYVQVQARVGGRVLSAPVSVTVTDHGVVPLLLSVTQSGLSAFAGNDRVNLGLALAGGRTLPLPDVPFTDQGNRPVHLANLGHRIVVVASFETHCHESCPLYTAVLSDLERVLASRGWRDRVAIAEVTMDPSRDTPEVLSAYAHMTGATWEFLTGPQTPLRVFWGALHATYREVPYTGAPPIDWYTGAPETHDVEHSSLAAVLDAEGYARFQLIGNPRLGHAVPEPLARLLSPEAARAVDGASTASWTLTDLLNRIDVLLNAPPEEERATEAALRPGSHVPDFTLSTLDGNRLSLHDELGHPVLVNFWATWCVPCRRELPRLARAAASRSDLAVLAVDERERGNDVGSFLRGVLGSNGGLTPLLDGDGGVGERYSVVGLQVSVFVDPGGTVRVVHIGELSDADLAAALATIGGRRSVPGE